MAGIFCSTVLSTALHANSSMDSTTTTTTYKEITPPAGLHIDGGAGFAISGDFIYWETREDGLEFAYSGQAGYAVTPSATLPQGQAYYPGFSYQPGFKVALEADLGHDNWDLAAEYSWLIAKQQSNSVTQDYATTTLFPTILTQTVDADAVNNPLTNASGVWGLHYNVVNLELGRDYFISENLTFRPHYGLSGAWLNQTYNVDYVFESQGSTTVTANLTEAYSQKFWGVGFRTGLDSGWHFDENWSIYGDFAAAVLWSSFKVASSEYDNLADAYNINTLSQTYGVQTVLDLEMGLRWSMVFDENSFGMMLQAGWDQQVWINHNQITSGNLNLQGLVVKARFDF